MKKIILELLKTKYPEANPEVLLELVDNSPNPEVATEMLCGLYKEPEYSTEPGNMFINTKEQENAHEIQFINYDKWNNVIVYSYHERESITIWLKKGDDIPSYQDVNNNKEDYLVGYWFEDIKKVRENNLDKGDYEKINIYGDLKPHSREGNTSIESWSQSASLPA